MEIGLIILYSLALVLYGMLGYVLGGLVEMKRKSKSTADITFKYPPAVGTTITASYTSRLNVDRIAFPIDIIFGNRGEAENVLTDLINLIEDYGYATINDVYTASDLEKPRTMTYGFYSNYGWTTLRDAYIERTKHGFRIVFPPLEKVTN